MVRKLLVIFSLFFFQVGFCENYSVKLNDAFFRQSQGKPENTNIAFLLFQQGVKEAKEAGESPQKLDVLSELFYWYRKYGYSAGVMLAPSGCSDEFMPFRNPGNRRSNYVYNPLALDYFTEHPLAMHADASSYDKATPQMRSHVREFMAGIAVIISGIMVGTVYPPLGLTCLSICIGGFLEICHALNGCWTERDKRIAEIMIIEEKAKNVLLNK